MKSHVYYNMFGHVFPNFQVLLTLSGSTCDNSAERWVFGAWAFFPGSTQRWSLQNVGPEKKNQWLVMVSNG